MLLTTLLLHYLEEYEGQGKIGKHADFRAQLNSKTPCPIYDLSLIFYTLLLALRIALVLVAVFEASRDQAKKMKPNFWLVFFAFWFPEVYLVMHVATGWHKETDIFTKKDLTYQ